MLVLSRKTNESIIINDDIIVTVVEIRGRKVQLGFDAPKEVPVHRQEVYDAIHREELCDVEVENGQNDCSQGESANHRPRTDTLDLALIGFEKQNRYANSTLRQ